MSVEKLANLVIKPRIEGLDEVESTLNEVMEHVMAALGGLESARAATVTVTALAELDETTD